MIRLFGYLTMTLVLLTGCGYHSLRNDGPFSGDMVNGVNGTHISLFENRSYRAGVDITLAKALVHEYAKHSGGMVLTEDNSQLILSGLVLSYATTPVSYSAADKIREYRAKISIMTIMQRSKTMEVLWKAELSQEQIFPANTDISLQGNAEDAAIEEICRKLALDIWRKIHEEF